MFECLWRFLLFFLVFSLSSNHLGKTVNWKLKLPWTVENFLSQLQEEIRELRKFEHYNLCSTISFHVVKHNHLEFGTRERFFFTIKISFSAHSKDFLRVEKVKGEKWDGEEISFLFLVLILVTWCSSSGGQPQ